MMLQFDAPDALQGMAVRSTTTIAPQSLLIMNSPIVRDWAAGLARRVLSRKGANPEEAVRAAYLITLARPPDAEELRDALTFLGRQRGLDAANEEAAFTDFCQVLLGLNEFIFIE
jgi:hypothetical protein